jgi:hypothetical protein
MNAPKIKTECVSPPIPIRSFDWCAYVEGTDEETRICGWGETEAKAIRDLRLISEDFPRRCLTNIVDGQDGSCWHCNAAQGETCRDPESRQV